MLAAPIAPIHPRALERVARGLRITIQGGEGEEAEERDWVPTRLQVRQWAASAQHRLLYTLKARQVFITTAELLNDLLFTTVNTERGHRIETWLIWHKDAVVRRKIAQIADWLAQLGCVEGRDYRHRDGDASIEIRRGRGRQPSRILGLTAGGSRSGTGETAHRVHVSELPYFRDAESTWISLGPALGLTGRGVIETTMAVSSPTARQVWDGAPAWHKLFYSVADHENYRLDPDKTVELTESTEQWLCEQGFDDLDKTGLADPVERRRLRAFVAWAYLNKCGGNPTETLREYPLTPEHCFMLAIGRWIHARPAVLPHRVELTSGAQSIEAAQGRYLKVYREPQGTSGYCVIGVDTGGALGRDASAVAVVDGKDGALCASWRDATTTTSQMIPIIARAQELYTHHPAREFWMLDAPPVHRPPAIVEDNGIGETTVQLAAEAGVEVQRYHATEDTKYRGLLLVKNAAEAGVLQGPEELRDEADALVTKEGKFQGPKDLCSAIAFCLLYLRDNPYRAPEEPDTQPRIDLARYLAPPRSW